MTVLEGALASLILGGILRAFGLPIAKWSVVNWVRLYTHGLANPICQGRRAEIDSDLWEQIHATQAEGYSPSDIAFKVAWRLILGVPSDIAWRLELSERWFAIRITYLLTYAVYVVARYTARTFLRAAVARMPYSRNPTLSMTDWTDVWCIATRHWRDIFHMANTVVEQAQLAGPRKRLWHTAFMFGLSFLALASLPILLVHPPGLLTENDVDE